MLDLAFDDAELATVELTDHVQHSEEWYRARVAKITGSRMADVMAYSERDGKPLKARENYMAELAVEILTGEEFQSSSGGAARIWGTDVEPLARAAYEARYGVIIKEVGFILHPSTNYVGCSPDGLVSSDGKIEVKCPYNGTNHLYTWRDGMPGEHRPQVQCGLWVTGRRWCDFISYDPRMPDPLQLYVQRIHRDDKYIARMAEECAVFWQEAQELVEAIRARADNNHGVMI